MKQSIVLLPSPPPQVRSWQMMRWILCCQVWRTARDKSTMKVHHQRPHSVGRGGALIRTLHYRCTSSLTPSFDLKLIYWRSIEAIFANYTMDLLVPRPFLAGRNKLWARNEVRKWMHQFFWVLTEPSFVPRPSPTPDVDHLQYALMHSFSELYCKQSKTGAGKAWEQGTLKPPEATSLTTSWWYGTYTATFVILCLVILALNPDKIKTGKRL